MKIYKLLNKVNTIFCKNFDFYIIYISFLVFEKKRRKYWKKEMFDANKKSKSRIFFKLSSFEKRTDFVSFILVYF